MTEYLEGKQGELGLICLGKGRGACVPNGGIRKRWLDVLVLPTRWAIRFGHGVRDANGLLWFIPSSLYVANEEYTICG